MASGEKIIGIDLGTTNSVVAVMEGTEVKVIGKQIASALNLFNCNVLYGRSWGKIGRAHV